MTQVTLTPQVDTRHMEARNRRTVAFSVFDQLEVGATMDVLNDQDPTTLRSQFELEKPNLFTWEHLESGPEVWRVAVTKLKGKHGVDHCCGACGG
jgi:uncharacterized protein (DUF2249 family)